MRHLKAAITDLELELKALDSRACTIRDAITSLQKLVGEPTTDSVREPHEPRQVDTEPEKPLSTALIELLEGKGYVHRDEIYEQVKQLGYKISGKTEHIKKRNLAILMSKHHRIIKSKDGTQRRLKDQDKKIG